MFTYQKIHIEYQLLQKIASELDTLDINRCRHNFNYLEINYVKSCCPVLFTWLSSKNVNPTKAAVIITEAGFYDSIPHVDAQVNCLALNFPIRNCDESETVFYTTKTPLETITLEKPNGVVYKSLKNKDWIEIEKYTLDSATLLNTHVPHKIINRGKNKRVALSIRFDPDPWNLLNE
jgi:hypothetical protein